jgi:hypothetical protein
MMERKLKFFWQNFMTILMNYTLYCYKNRKRVPRVSWSRTTNVGIFESLSPQAACVGEIATWNFLVPLHLVAFLPTELKRSLQQQHKCSWIPRNPGIYMKVLKVKKTALVWSWCSVTSFAANAKSRWLPLMATLAPMRRWSWWSRWQTTFHGTWENVKLRSVKKRPNTAAFARLRGLQKKLN